MISTAKLVGAVAILAAISGLFYMDATGEEWPLAFSLAMTLVAFACGVAAALESRR